MVAESRSSCFSLIQMSHVPPSCQELQVFLHITSVLVTGLRACGSETRTSSNRSSTSEMQFIDLGEKTIRSVPITLICYDSILALDCAYHFHTRRDFLRQSLSHLAPGGRIALADICFPTSWKTMSLGTRALLAVLNVIPKENIVSLDEYEADMRKMGYVDVKVEDVSKEVFPEFIRF